MLSVGLQWEGNTLHGAKCRPCPQGTHSEEAKSKPMTSYIPAQNSHGVSKPLDLLRVSDTKKDFLEGPMLYALS